MTTYVLIHGAWHDGASWNAVASALRQQGHLVHAPTLLGHGRGVDKNVNHAQCVKSVTDYILKHDLHDFVLVGHSFGGTVIALVAAQLPQRVRSLVFLNAFVPRNGHSLLDEVPPHYGEFFAQLAAESKDNTITLPFEMWHNGFMNDADIESARHIYEKHLSPEPFGLFAEPLDLTGFYELTLPRSYLYCTDDQVFPYEEWDWVPRFPDRLGPCRMIEMPGSHEAMFIAPGLMANKIMEAGHN